MVSQKLCSVDKKQKFCLSRTLTERRWCPLF